MGEVDKQAWKDLIQNNMAKAAAQKREMLEKGSLKELKLYAKRTKDAETNYVIALRYLKPKIAFFRKKNAAMRHLYYAALAGHTAAQEKYLAIAAETYKLKNSSTKKGNSSQIDVIKEIKKIEKKRLRVEGKNSAIRTIAITSICFLAFCVLEYYVLKFDTWLAAELFAIVLVPLIGIGLSMYILDICEEERGEDARFLAVGGCFFDLFIMCCCLILDVILLFLFFYRLIGLLC